LARFGGVFPLDCPHPSDAAGTVRPTSVT